MEKQPNIKRYAVPVANGKLCLHFGHCESFAIVDYDQEAKVITSTVMENPPQHEPGVLPKWLHEQGADVIISGGMGTRAQAIFQQFNIAVVIGAPIDEPNAVVTAFEAGELTAGDNVCDH
ncbi:NifB/NifX family molybdenum-iron cluster-binding protein [bacterium]|nr:NifB/NifX family molybdenum-iron cluster-binding protein [bacterium]